MSTWGVYPSEHIVPLYDKIWSTPLIPTRGQYSTDFSLNFTSPTLFNFEYAVEFRHLHEPQFHG